jgi:hypothetical protein
MGIEEQDDGSERHSQDQRQGQDGGTLPHGSIFWPSMSQAYTPGAGPGREFSLLRPPRPRKARFDRTGSVVHYRAVRERRLPA